MGHLGFIKAFGTSPTWIFISKVKETSKDKRTMSKQEGPVLTEIAPWFSVRGRSLIGSGTEIVKSCYRRSAVREDQNTSLDMVSNGCWVRK